MNKIIMVLLMMLPSLLLSKDDLKKAFEQMINTELSFSALSESKGTKEAFVTYLDDNSIVFRPLPVNGKEFYRNRKAVSGTLKWKPEFADISVSGNFGFTTGPYEYSRDTLKGFGHFVTVWHKIDGTNWKALIDAGISHDRADADNTVLPLFNKQNKILTTFDSLKSSKEIFTLDNNLTYSANNGKDNYTGNFAKDIRFYLEGHMPVINSGKVKEFIKHTWKSMASLPQKAIVSKTGDLGYTYGTMDIQSDGESTAQKEKLVYLRIWQRQGNSKWALILEVSNPVK